ncbi:MAG: DEAD/DEAH box helicase [Phycisphaerae bacterium]|nr:DEAD/DEAH box helicase [Phycisphaerae bacterium]
MEPETRTETNFAEVALNLGLDKTFLYSIPEELQGEIRIGQRVGVPFGKSNRAMVGYVADLCSECRLTKVKAVREIIDPQTVISDELMELASWMSRYYVAPLGVVLDAILPAAVKRNVGFKSVRLVVRGDADESQAGRILSKQRRVLDVLDSLDSHVTPRELARQAGCTVAVIKALEKRGLVRIEKVKTEEFARDLYLPVEEFVPVHLTAEQQLALQLIKQKIASDRFAAVLVHGVTGSGKTELYLRAIAEVVDAGRQAIVLVPEIALTPQTIRRFRQRFTEVAVLHSHLSDIERHRQWRDIAAGRAQVVIGARSAVFAPCPDLGLIVIDDEHENSFKQDTSPRYHGRDVAVMRAHLLGIPILLGSATPSL